MLGQLISRWFHVNIPGLGILVSLILIFLVGIFVSNVVGNGISKFIEWVLARTPFIRTLYMPLKDVIKSISGENKSKSFRKVVFVEFPIEGSHSLGFVTNEFVMVAGVKKEAIFIPTTPNPTNGYLIYVNSEKYIEIDMTVDAALRTIVSLGTVSPEVINEKLKNREDI